jgi:hypothetical protein
LGEAESRQQVKLICDRLVEIILVGTVTNLYSRATNVVAVQGVKGLVTDFDSRWQTAVAEHR